jgi:hypothetical protein
LPLNPVGGNLGTGRIHGLWHIIAGASQASSRAGSRQVKDANVSFVGASAPIVTGTTFIFVSDPYFRSTTSRGRSAFRQRNQVKNIGAGLAVKPDEETCINNR